MHAMAAPPAAYLQHDGLTGMSITQLPLALPVPLRLCRGGGGCGARGGAALLDRGRRRVCRLWRAAARDRCARRRVQPAPHLLAQPVGAGGGGEAAVVQPGAATGEGRVRCRLLPTTSPLTPAARPCARPTSASHLPPLFPAAARRRRGGATTPSSTRPSACGRWRTTAMPAASAASCSSSRWRGRSPPRRR